MSAADDFARLSINTATIKYQDLATAVDLSVAAGLSHIGLWRDRVAEAGLKTAASMVADAGLSVSSLCRGGFLTAADDDGRRRAFDDNRRAIEEAAALGTGELIMVVGGLPAAGALTGAAGADPASDAGQDSGGAKDLEATRGRVAEALERLAPVAEQHGVRLVLEPLHPMYAADRAVISTLGQALDLAAPFSPDVVGVVVDTFHVWWDPALREQVRRAGVEGRIASYQVCDWNLPIAADALLSRGYMGDGYIDFAPITRWVDEAGYTGPIEVEIFNQQVWGADPAEVVATVKDRYCRHILPFTR